MPIGAQLKKPDGIGAGAMAKEIGRGTDNVFRFTTAEELDAELVKVKEVARLIRLAQWVSRQEAMATKVLERSVGNNRLRGVIGCQ